MALESTIKSYLSGKHITVPDEWVTACLQWIQSEVPNINFNNTRQVTEMAYEQWLHADLTELASSCLPFGLQQKRSVMLNGPFVLQINHVRDVGHPAYPVLQKLRRIDAENTIVSADQQYQRSWEPKPTRMIMMQMTDGTSVIQGIEYRPIPHLNVNLKPGSKIILSGSIMCRKGILLLTKEHITVLGGEIEHLLVKNALENVLSRALGVEETEEPNNFDVIPAGTVPPSQASQYYPSQLSHVSSRSQNTSQTARGIRNPSALNARGGREDNRQQSSTAVRSHSQAASSIMIEDDDDFLNPEFESVLEQLESESGSVTDSNSALSDSKTTQLGPSQGITNDLTNKNSTAASVSVDTYGKTTNSMVDVSEDFFDDSDDDFLLLAEEASHEAGFAASSTQQKLCNSVVSHQTPSNPPNKVSTANNILLGTPRQNTSFKRPSNIIVNEVEIGESSSSQQAKNRIYTSKILPETPRPSTSFQRPSNFKVNKIEIGDSLLSQNANSRSYSSNILSGTPRQITSYKRPSSFIDYKVETGESSLSRQANKGSVISFAKKRKASATQAVITNFMKPSGSQTQNLTIDDEESESSIRLSQDTITRDISSARYKLMVKRQTDVVLGEKLVSLPPFTYLCSLPMEPTKRQEYIIKGFIMTLTSKLDYSGDKWRLNGKINDGSASREVDIDDKVLCELLTMNVQEFMERKMAAKENPELRSELAKKVADCQGKLIALYSLIKLEVLPNNPKPRIMELIPINRATVEQLSGRLSSSDL